MGISRGNVKVGRRPSPGWRRRLLPLELHGEWRVTAPTDDSNRPSSAPFLLSPRQLTLCGFG
jgi:hypothetical protein